MRLCSVTLLLLACACPAAAQPDPPVYVPRIEVATGVSIEHSSAGAVASICGNVTHILAVTSEISTSGGGVALLAGGRITTGFSYDGKPPMPGRFFAQFMIGRERGSVVSAGTIVQPGVGADVIVVPHVGVSFHWSLDYKHIVGAPPERFGARLVAALVFGPRA